MRLRYVTQRALAPMCLLHNNFGSIEPCPKLKAFQKQKLAVVEEILLECLTRAPSKGRTLKVENI